MASKDHAELKQSEIEAKLSLEWQDSSVYEPLNSNSDKPFYNLMMFPYPSAEGLHVGNMYAFCGSDVYGRFKRMNGYDVFEPIGLDGFGIHSENYAMKIGKHPVDLSKITEQNFYRQLASIGNGYSWNFRVETYKDDYYKWTQWIFVQLFKNGLAYRQKGTVNWCPSCLTVLADEQVIGKETEAGEVQVCERCSSKVEQKELVQWYFRITHYAERLLDSIADIDWDEKIKVAQRNWIGRSDGAQIVFVIDIDKRYSVTVFTTRPDTLAGVTFMVLAAEHPLVTTILDNSKSAQRQAILDFLDHSIKKKNKVAKSDEKRGIFTGYYARNPINDERVPVYISDYVVMGYGTGAVMGVPAHDQRDWEFAKKHKLEIKQVVRGDKEDEKISRTAFTGLGVLVNSGKYDGLSSDDAKEKIVEDLLAEKKAQKSTNWHLRDWIISRQRYWGPPIPMIYCSSCAKAGKSWHTENKSDAKISDELNWEHHGWYPEAESSLPVRLPFVSNFRPTGSGKSPLSNDEDFYKVKCPNCKSDAVRETDVSDTFLDSSWYFLRYPSAKNEKVAWDKSITRKWLPVDMYIGGAEHSVLHLLYSRFVTKVFFDLGLVDFEEPFTKFRAHGLLIKDGAKMSKSKGNVVVPDDYIAKFGADTLRTYLMFCGRFQQGGDFRDEGIEGMQRFLKRVWKLSFDNAQELTSEPDSKQAVFMMNKTVKKVTEDIENLGYNTAIAAIMEWMNFLEKQEKLSQAELKSLLKLLAPFAPFMTEEIWHKIKLGEGSIHTSDWPGYDKQLAISNEVMLIVQVNGRVRDKINVDRGISEEKAVQLAKESEKVSKFTLGKKEKNIIFVPDRLINIVVD